MNKSKRQIFCKLALLTGITEIVWQVTSYSKMFEVGSHRLIHGKTTILPVDHDTPGRQRGSLQVAPFQNGSRPGQDPFYGSMGNVSLPTSIFSQGVTIFTPDSGRGKERSFVC